jgi:propanol-preferring alcohol dehydrogenase
MKAWVIDKTCDLSENFTPLSLIDIPAPVPKEGELLIEVKTCGICHTEIDEIEGRTPPPNYPVIPGHQVVGVVKESKGKLENIRIGDRVGVAWIYSACKNCEYCRSGQENLCKEFLATGRDRNGGYAEYMTVSEQFVYHLPDFFNDVEAAPLLCAGAIGYRSLDLCLPRNGQFIGLTGFGASAHLVLKLIRNIYPETKIYVFARNRNERKLALELGATWSGDTEDRPDVLLDSIIDTTPVWKPIINALECIKPGGRLVINSIRKEHHDKDHLLNLNYPIHLWMEKEIKSVANVTRNDVLEFIRIAAKMKFKPEIQIYPFEKANIAILDIKNKNIKGAKVLMIKS